MKKISLTLEEKPLKNNQLLFIIYLNKTLLSFRVSKSITLFDKLRSIHSILKEKSNEWGLKEDKKFFLCGELEENAQLFTFTNNYDDFKNLNKSLLANCNLEPKNPGFIDKFETFLETQLVKNNYTYLTLKDVDFSTKIKFNNEIKNLFNKSFISSNLITSLDSTKHSFNYYVGKKNLIQDQTHKSLCNLKEKGSIELWNDKEFLEIFNSLYFANIKIFVILTHIFGFSTKKAINIKKEEIDLLLTQDSSRLKIAQMFQGPLNYIEELKQQSEIHFQLNEHQFLFPKSNFRKRPMTLRVIRRKLLNVLQLNNLDHLKYYAILHFLLVSDFHYVSIQMDVSISLIYYLAENVFFEVNTGFRMNH